MLSGHVAKHVQCEVYYCRALPASSGESCNGASSLITIVFFTTPKCIMMHKAKQVTLTQPARE